MLLGRSRTVFDNVVEEEIEHVIESFQWKLWNVSLCWLFDVLPVFCVCVCTCSCMFSFFLINIWWIVRSNYIRPGCTTSIDYINISKTIKGTMVSLCCCFQGGWNRFWFCWTFLLSGVEAWNVGEYLGQSGNCQRACLRDLCQNFQVPQISHFKILYCK